MFDFPQQTQLSHEQLSTTKLEGAVLLGIFHHVGLSYFYNFVPKSIFKELFQVQVFLIHSGAAQVIWPWVLDTKYFCHRHGNPTWIFAAWQIQVRENVSVTFI